MNIKSAPAKVTRAEDAWRIVGAAWGAPIAAVEVRIDDGPWQPATIDRTHESPNAWRIWSYDWPNPAAGEHRVTSRAIDNDGNVQPAMDNPWIAGRGLAWAFVRYSTDYVEAEASARSASLGIWLALTQTAWDYREDRWNGAVAEAPGDCPIKGNIARNGERIYHTPWSRWYGRTEINTAAGELWFCDEAEAQAAGWRAARSR